MKYINRDEDLQIRSRISIIHLKKEVFLVRISKQILFLEFCSSAEQRIVNIK